MSSRQVSVIVVVLCLVVGAISLMPELKAQVGDDRTKEKNMAFVRGGLVAAAAVVGTYTKMEVVYLGEPLSLEALVNKSERIVVGEPVNGVPELTEDGRSIVTRTEFRIIDVLKGPKGKSVDVMLPGGRVSFSNGTWAEVRVRDFPVPIPVHNYLVFLEANGSDMVPCFGQLGIFEVKDLAGTPSVTASRMSSHSFFVDWLLRRNYTTGQLLSDVRTLSGASKAR